MGGEGRGREGGGLDDTERTTPILACPKSPESPSGVERGVAKTSLVSSFKYRETNNK